MRHPAIGVALVTAALAIPATALCATTHVARSNSTARIIASARSALAEGTVFHLDTPPENATVAGVVEVAGWVIDDRGVSNIDLFVDGVFVASADLNKPRYDVLQAYPWYAGTVNARPGFSTSFNAEDLTNGAHTIFVRITFSDASVEDFGTRTVVVDKDLNQAPFGELEMPGPNQPMNGVFPVTGWALDNSEVVDIEVMVDGQVIGQANSGVARPDINHRFPTIPNSANAGFIRMLNTSTFTNGVHTLAVRLRDDEGATRVIGRRFVQIMNNGRNLVPFGRIEWPIANHYLFATGCNNPGGWSGPNYNDPDQWELIWGWAADVGSSTDAGGVAWVKLMLDGVELKNTWTDEFYFPLFLRDVNYYGIERPDVFKLLPDVPASKDSGFDFAINPSSLVLDRGVHQGLHYLSVVAGDVAGNTGTIGTIPVIVDCNDDPDRPSTGDIYTPANMERTAGVTPVTGWAIDPDRILKVEVMIDGDIVGYANFGLASPEVCTNFPWYPPTVCGYAGYRFDLDTTTLTDGEHRLVIRVQDSFGSETYVGQRTFVVDNLN